MNHNTSAVLQTLLSQCKVPLQILWTLPASSSVNINNTEHYSPQHDQTWQTSSPLNTTVVCCALKAHQLEIGIVQKLVQVAWKCLKPPRLPNHDKVHFRKPVPGFPSSLLSRKSRHGTKAALFPPFSTGRSRAVKSADRPLESAVTDFML